MHARVGGGPPDSPTVVLLHGLVVSSRYMSPLGRALAPLATVFAPDMPGFGRSDDPGRVLDVPALAGHLGEWLDVQNLDEVVLVANSFGCQYAARLVAADPKRVRKLVLLGPTMDPSQRTAPRQALRWLATCPSEPPSLGLVIARDLVDCGPIRAALTFHYALRHAIEHDLPQIAVETVVVRGGRDLVASQRWCEQATALLPKGRLVEIPRAGHALNYNSPDRVAELVASLL
jgi:2-hydroxy-6-oxonona-2,4-dienedioate hydrolase